MHSGLTKMQMISDASQAMPDGRLPRVFDFDEMQQYMPPPTPRKAFGVKDKEQWKAQLGIADTGCGKYGDGYKMGFHLALNDYLTLWEHTLDSAEMRKAMETCPLQKHPAKEGSKVVDAACSYAVVG